MTKFEWERELRRRLADLPKDEVQKVMEYYDELFMDGIDAGKTETEITAGFGSPEDVARKIISESKKENSAEEVVDAEPKSGEQSKNRNLDIGKLLGFILSLAIKILWKGCVIFAVSVVAVGFAGVALSLIGAGLIALGSIGGLGALAAIANIGISLAGIGLGLVLLPSVCKVFKWAVKQIANECTSFVSEVKEEGADIYED